MREILKMSSLSLAKGAVLAGVLSIAGLATPAAAHTYTRCDWDGDRCVRIHCDWDGDDCWQESVYSRQPYYQGYGRWQCDWDGDDCRWVYDRPNYYDPRYYDPRYYDPDIELGLGLGY